jgi:hypothetical protein
MDAASIAPTIICPVVREIASNLVSIININIPPAPTAPFATAACASPQQNAPKVLPPRVTAIISNYALTANTSTLNATMPATTVLAPIAQILLYPHVKVMPSNHV